MREEKDVHRYDDIIDLPHYQSKTRPHMSLYDRAAQFSPFAALTGHDAAIKETARLTDSQAELDEDEKAILNEKLQIIQDNIGRNVPVTISYFEPDERKTGGAYVSCSGLVKKIDTDNHSVVMTDKREILIERISEIDSELFIYLW